MNPFQWMSKVLASPPKLLHETIKDVPLDQYNGSPEVVKDVRTALLALAADGWECFIYKDAHGKLCVHIAGLTTASGAPPLYLRDVNNFTGGVKMDDEVLARVDKAAQKVHWRQSLHRYMEYTKVRYTLDCLPEQYCPRIYRFYANGITINHPQISGGRKIRLRWPTQRYSSGTMKRIRDRAFRTIPPWLQQLTTPVKDEHYRQLHNVEQRSRNIDHINDGLDDLFPSDS